jgi:predicted transposase YbfD/YdcC
MTGSMRSPSGSTKASEIELARLRVPRDPFTRRLRRPSASTIRRALTGADPNALVAAVLAPDTPRRDEADTETASAAQASTAQAPVVGAVALDGKSCRGARRDDGTRVHLVGAVTHKDGLLVGHVEVDRKSNETTAFQPLLAPMDLTDTVVTFDALHSVRKPRMARHGEQGPLPGRDQSQPAESVRPAQGPVMGRPPGRRRHPRPRPRRDPHGEGHHRGPPGLPHAARAIRIHRWRRETGKAPSRETVYAVTDLTFRQAGGALLNDLARSQRTIC